MEYAVRTVDQLAPILKAFRKTRGLTQAELAQRLGITQQALSQLEASPCSASFERLLALFCALDVELLVREKEKPHKIPSGEW